MSQWLARIDEAAARARALEQRLAQAAQGAQSGPQAQADRAQLGRELAALRPVLAAGSAYQNARAALSEARELSADADPELRALAREESAALEERCTKLERELRVLLLPKDPNDARDAILEIRAGTGGDEAALFAADLFRMYARYAEARGFRMEPLSQNATGGGGFKEIIVGVAGAGAYGRLKYERGVHRVQRVPATESQGRVHTSTCTVAIMPEAEAVDISVRETDLKVDVFRSSGPGGQSVNTTDSAVRITHLPTGLVVTCQDEKSQHKNKSKALKVLRARLLAAEQEAQAQARATARRAQVGSGFRSEKIRTYNFPQNRITDHRAGLTLHKLDRVLEGALEEVLEGLLQWEAEQQERALAAGAEA